MKALYNMPPLSRIVKRELRKIAKKARFALFLTLLLAPFRLAAEEVTLLAFADSHARLGGLNRLRALAERERAEAPDLLLIDAGDTLQGTFEGAYDRGAATLAMLNAMRVDIWVPGNHDFDAGPPPFDRFAGTVLGADWCREQLDQGESRAAGEQPPRHSEADVRSAWTRVERRGRTIVFIGLGETQMPFRRLSWRGDAEEAALDRVMPEVRRARPDAVVLIRHGGLFWRGGGLAELLRRHPEIDLVIGAHTHQEHDGERVGSAWYVQPGCHAQALARIRLDFNERNGRLRRITSELLRPDPNETPPWPETVRPLLERARQAAAEPVTIQEPDLAEAMRRAANADAALYVGHPLPEPLPATEGELYRALPYEDRIVTVRATPAVLEQLLADETALAKRYPGREHHFSAVSDWRRRDRLTLAVTDYYLAGSGGLTLRLRPLIGRGAYRDTGISLREAVQRPEPPR